jgi:hypothetical protein
MDNKLTKSLTDLIDETLLELDELRKSRFSASEIKIEGPGDGIDGKPSNGNLDAKKADDEDEDDKDDKDDKKDMDKADCDDMGKADDEDEDEDEDEDDEDDAKKSDDDPADSANTKRKVKDLMNKEEDEDDKEKEEKKEMKKSFEESESLMKSYVEERVKPLEDKLSTILDLVNKIADQPVTAKGVTARTPVTPLLKSGDAGSYETLSKGEVASKLFELKKSGTKVDSLDITKAEMGQDLQTIIKKYEIS